MRLAGDPVVRPDLSDPSIQAVVGGTVAINLLVLAIPLYINRIYTSVLPQKAGDSLLVITLLLALVLVVDVLLKALRAWILSWMGASSEHRLRLAAARCLLATDLGHGQATSVQARLAQLRSAGPLRALFEQQWLVRRVELPFTLVLLLVLGLIGGWLVLIPLLLAPLFMQSARRASREIADALQHRHHCETSLSETLYASLLASPTIKTFNLEGFLVRRLEPAQERLSQSGYQQEATLARLQNLSALFSQLNQVLIVSIGAWLVIRQDISTGALAACTLLGGQVTTPLAKVFAADGQLAACNQALEDLRQLQALPPEPNLFTGDAVPDRGVLELTGLTLAPASTALILAGDPEQSSQLLGSCTGLTAPIPADGRFAGRPLTVFERSQLRRRLRLLVPEPGCMQGTLLDNLTGFATEQRGVEAAALCARHGLAPLIQALPKGYATPVGAGEDFPLSKGLLFRVQVIAALLDDPAVLLLDAAQISLSDELLRWFVGLELEASRLIAVQQPPAGWADGLSRYRWQGAALQEVAA